MDNDIITIAIWIAVGAALALIVDSYTKGIYIPRLWHQVFPAISFLIGFHVWTKFKNDIGAFLILLAFIAKGLMHGYALMKLMIIFQNYNTAINTPDPKITIVDAQKTYPELVPIPTSQTYKPAIQPMQQVVALPKFDKERYVAFTLCRMNENGFKVDLTETRWVKNWKFSRGEFTAMLDNWKRHGLIDRASDKRNAGYKVVRWEAVKLIASGNPLPPPLN